MTIYCLGSINLDHVYRVPHIPAPGETVLARNMATGLGGKGTNQSVAAARAGARVVHIGAVGADGDWAVMQLRGYDVDCQAVQRVQTPTGHAVLTVDDVAENAITVFSGANMAVDIATACRVLETAQRGDILMLQNETNGVAELAQYAKTLGLRVLYSAAPFDVLALKDVLPFADIIAVNSVEYTQLTQALGDIDGPDFLITLGAKGAKWQGAQCVQQPAFQVSPVDTTGAGDCFAGSFAALLDQGADVADALRYAAAAAALQVTKPGAAQAMPNRAEVEEFLAQGFTQAVT
jgi:ribokinase